MISSNSGLWSRYRINQNPFDDFSTFHVERAQEVD
jgi:hypothetical protein